VLNVVAEDTVIWNAEWRLAEGWVLKLGWLGQIVKSDWVAVVWSAVK